MEKSSRTLGKKITRRDFLKGTGAVGLGLAGLPALSGCAPSPTSAPEAATPAPAPTPTPHVAEINFRGWTYRPDLVQLNTDRFTGHYPNIKVNYEATPWAAYTEKILSGFTAGPIPDVLYVHVAGPGWVEAGYLRPIDDLPGLDELKADMYPGAIETATFDGKMYGLPYFTGGTVFAYNEEILEQAGISEPPKSLNELKEQCLIIKEKGILDMPMMAPEHISTNGRPFYSLLYASGGRLFDDAGNPIPLTENKMAVDVMDWCAKAHQEWGIWDPAGLTLNWEEVAKVFNDGKLAFEINYDYNLARANNPEVSQVAGKALFDLMPGLGPESQGTWNQGWWYGLAADTKELDAAWEFLKYVGGKDWEGKYYVSKQWLKEEGLLFAYESMFDDPEVKEALERYRDLDMLSNAIAGGKPMEHFHAGWFAEWADFFSASYQDACTGVKSPEEALQDSLDKAAELMAG